MSEGINKVILLGNLGTDPELRYMQSGTPKLQFRMATHDTYIDKNKEPQDRTEWHQVVIWGPRAEGLAKVLSKGICVVVEGALRTQTYEKDGEKRYFTEIHAREVYLTGRRPLDEPKESSTRESAPESTSLPPMRRSHRRTLPSGSEPSQHPGT